VAAAPACRSSAGLRRARLPARGELIGDKDLVERAAGAWRRQDDLEQTIRALWAGRVGDEREVVLMSGRRAVAVEFDLDNEDPRTYDSEFVPEGSPLVPAHGAVVARAGAPDRWTAVSSEREPGVVSYSSEVRSVDGLLPFDDTEGFIALAPLGDGGGESVPVLVGIGRDGYPWPAVVPAADWPEVRREITQDVISKLAAAALGAAAADITNHTDGIPSVWLLPDVELPGDVVEYAASARTRAQTAISFATGDVNSPTVDVLGVSDFSPGLAAKAIAGGS
jgi:hypothetical protein